MGRKKREDGCKMLPCHKCCPAGYDSQGRYHRAYGVAHEYTVEDWEAEPRVWGWACQNCGHFKKPRATRETASATYAMDTATTDAKLNVKNAALFHYFNPHGCVALKRAMDKRVDRAIEDTGCPNGALMVHGGLDTYHVDKLGKLAMAKAPKRFNVWYHIGQIQERMIAADKWIAEVYAKYGMEVPEL